MCKVCFSFIFGVRILTINIIFADHSQWHLNATFLRECIWIQPVPLFSLRPLLIILRALIMVLIILNPVYQLSSHLDHHIPAHLILFPPSSHTCLSSTPLSIKPGQPKNNSPRQILLNATGVSCPCSWLLPVLHVFPFPKHLPLCDLTFSAYKSCLRVCTALSTTLTRYKKTQNSCCLGRGLCIKALRTDWNVLKVFWKRSCIKSCQPTFSPIPSRVYSLFD